MEPVPGAFVIETADNRGVPCVKLPLNKLETCLPAEAWTVNACATFRIDLPTMLVSEIQLPSSQALPKTLDLEEIPKTPIEYPAIVTAVAPDDGIGADTLLETKHFE